MLGRKVKSLVSEKLNAGSYTVEFNGSDYASGVYFYKLEMKGKEIFVQTKKMMLIK